MENKKENAHRGRKKKKKKTQLGGVIGQVLLNLYPDWNLDRELAL